MDSKRYHFLSAMTCAMLMLPFGIIATALTPIIIGFAKEIYLQSTHKKGNAENFAWVIYGSAIFLIISYPFRSNC